MSLPALALVLLAALLHATWNLAAKKAGGDHRFAFIAALLAVVGWSPAVVWVGLEEFARWSAWAWAVILVSAFLHLLYFMVLLTGYRRSDLTVVYPVARGTGPLLAVLGAWIWLREPLTVNGAVGALLVCGGVFIIAGGPALWARSHAPEQRERVLAGIRWGALTGTFIASYTLVDGYAVKVLLLSPILLDWIGNALRLPVLAVPALRHRGGFVQAWRSQWHLAAVVAALGPLSYVLVLYAVKLAPVSHVAPARELSMLFAALLGGQLLGEGDRWLRLAGALFIAVGVMTLALA